MKKTESENEPFNLLKRVILLEERTRNFEESQVRLSFLESQLQELSTPQNNPIKQSIDFEKQLVALDDKVQSLENKYGKLIEQIHVQIKEFMYQPQQNFDLQAEFDNINQLMQQTEKQQQTKWTQFREELDRQLAPIHKQLKDVQNTLEKQATQQSNYQSGSDNRRDQTSQQKPLSILPATLTSIPTETSQRKENPSSVDPRPYHQEQRNLKDAFAREYQKDYSQENRVQERSQQPSQIQSELVPRLLSMNKDGASKSTLTYQPLEKLPYGVPQSTTSQATQFSRQQDIEKQLQANRDLSGLRGSTRPNPYRQRDSTNIRERNPQDTEIRFEQTKRFIDDEINRRLKEERDNRSQKPSLATNSSQEKYASIRDQNYKRFF